MILGAAASAGGIVAHHEEESGEERARRTGKGEGNAGLEKRSRLGAEIWEQKRGVVGG